MLLYKSWTFLFFGNCCTVYYTQWLTDRPIVGWVRIERLDSYWQQPWPRGGNQIDNYLRSNKEFYTDSNGCDFLKWVKIWCFCFLLIRSSAVEKTFTGCFSVQVLDCFGWLQIENLMLPVVTPTIWAWGIFGVLGLIFLDWFAGARSEDRLGLDSQRAYCWQLLSSAHSPRSLHFMGLWFRILGVEGWGFRV
jgi:hypothetical protein